MDCLIVVIEGKLKNVLCQLTMICDSGKPSDVEGEAVQAGKRELLSMRRGEKEFGKRYGENRVIFRGLNGLLLLIFCIKG